MTKSLFVVSFFLFSFSAVAAPSFVPLVAYVERDGAPMNETVAIQVMLHDEGATGGSSVAIDVEVTVVDGLLVTDLVVDENAMAQVGADPVFEIILDDENMGVIRVGETLFARNAENATTADSALTATSADSVAWGNITGVPAGFADGIDANTLYSAGSGLLLTSGTSFSIASSGVTAGHLATNSVGSAEIAENAVTSSEIAADAVGAAQIIDESVGYNELAENSVTSAKVVNGAIATSDLAARAVTTDKLAISAVSAYNIAVGAVENAKLELTISDGSTTGTFSRTSSSDTESCGANKIAKFCGLTYNSCIGTGNCRCRIERADASWKVCAKGDTSPLAIATCRMSCF